MVGSFQSIENPRHVFVIWSLYKNRYKHHTNKQTTTRNTEYIISTDLEILSVVFRLGPRVKKVKNGYPESSKVCYSINWKKYIWCIRNHCLANFSELHNATRANKVW